MRHHNNIVILTGAGISAESGLSTFRGNNGLWEGQRIDEVCTPDWLARNPDRVCSFYDELRDSAARAQPNPAHLALAKLQRNWLEQQRGDFLLITQNVDDLHERAGSNGVLHMHGELNTARCVECGWRGQRYVALADERDCPVCDCLALRPDIVLFGEAPRQLSRIETALQSCNLFLAIGTSGEVHPAASFVDIAKTHGAECHQFDVELTGNSPRFDECHIGAASESLPEWVNGIRCRALNR